MSRTVIGLFIFFSFQCLTFMFFGRASLIRQTYLSSKSYLMIKRPFRLIVVYCNCQEKIENSALEYSEFYTFRYEYTKPLPPKDKEEFLKLFKEQFDTIKFVSKTKELDKLKRDFLDVEYSVCLHTKYPFMSHVPEEIYFYDRDSNDGFVNSRETIYFWFLFKWFEIANIDGGSS